MFHCSSFTDTIIKNKFQVLIQVYWLELSTDWNNQNTYLLGQFISELLFSQIFTLAYY